MFRELRNKFLILNLVIISIMMLIAFTSIYLITFNDIHTEIDSELRKLSQFNLRFDNPEKQPHKSPPDSNNHSEIQRRSVSFSLTIDGGWHTTHISSILDMEDSFYETTKNAVLSADKNKGFFKLEGNHWAFMKRPNPEGYKIVYLDITPQQNILINLIYTFLLVACIMLIFIFLISRFFANKAIEPIKSSFDKQKQFIADASHELKTPLSVISTNIDVLLSNADIDTALGNEAKWLYYIKNEAERMAKLTNDLLYLTQVDYSEIKTIFTHFNLSETTLNAVLTMEAIIYENNISLQYDIKPDITFWGNNEQIKEVVMILLDNAAKYTNIEGEIYVTLNKQHNHLLLSVTNTGEGISEEAIGKVFDRFYRIDKARSRTAGSYGLGLPIAKAIIKQHAGKISVQSTLHEKTTFCIELPCT